MKLLILWILFTGLMIVVFFDYYPKNNKSNIAHIHYNDSLVPKSGEIWRLGPKDSEDFKIDSINNSMEMVFCHNIVDSISAHTGCIFPWNIFIERGRKILNASPKCPVGQTYLAGLSTSDFVVENGCYIDSIAKKILQDFYKDLCEQGGMATGSEGLYKSTTSKWNDSTGCSVTEVYKKEVFYTVNGKKKSKWVNISQKEFSQLCKCEWIFDPKTGKEKPLWNEADSFKSK